MCLDGKPPRQNHPERLRAMAGHRVWERAVKMQYAILPKGKVDIDTLRDIHDWLIEQEVVEDHA